MLNNLVRNSRNLLILGAVLAIAAFVLAFVALTRLQTPATTAVPRGPTTVTISGTVVAVSSNVIPPTAVPAPALIAIRDVAPMTQFGDSSVASKYFRQVPLNPKNPAPPVGYIGGRAALSSLIALSGTQETRIKIPRGEPLLADELMTATVPGTIDFAPLLRTGEVAESIQVGPVAADNGNVQPSDHVDLLLSFNVGLTVPQAATYKLYNPFNRTAAPPYKIISPTNSTGATPVGSETLTQLTLQNLRVLNVASATTASENVYTLALTHQQALFLKWVKDDGAGTTQSGSSGGSGGPSYELTVRSGADSTDSAPVLVKNIKTVSSNALTDSTIISNTLLLP